MGTVKESKSLTDIPPYFEQNTQRYPMSERGAPAATRFVACNFTLDLCTLDLCTLSLITPSFEVSWHVFVLYPYQNL